MGGLFGGGGGTAPKIDPRKFDFRQQVKDRVQPARDASQGLIQQLQAQTTGQAPSLATAQLKAAQDRNLSQLMAAASAQRGGNPALMQRQLAQQQGQQGRQLAQDSGVARLQEQQAAQQLLGQVGQSQQGQDLAQIMQPGQLYSQGEKYRYDADKARVDAVKQQQNNILGNVVGTVGRGVAAFYTGGASEATGAGQAIQGGLSGAVNKAEGGMVEGPEVVPGDSQANDVVEARLSAGEMVIPKTVVEQGPSAVKGFAEAVMRQHKLLNKDNDDIAKALKARKMSKGGMAEKPCYSDGGIVDILKQKYTEAAAKGYLGTYTGTQAAAQKKLNKKPGG